MQFFTFGGGGLPKSYVRNYWTKCVKICNCSIQILPWSRWYRLETRESTPCSDEAVLEVVCLGMRFEILIRDQQFLDLKHQE